MPAAPSKSVRDYMYDFYQSVVTGTGPTLFGTLNTNLTNGLASVQQTTDLVGYGEKTSATAGTVITDNPALPSLSAGTWDLQVQYNASGTTAGLDRPNMGIKVGVATPIVLIATMGGITDIVTYRLTVGGATTVSIVAIANSTASSVYRASIWARRAA